MAKASGVLGVTKMSGKHKSSQQTSSTRLASKLSAMAEEKASGEETVSMVQLVSELAKQRSVLKDDISTLILQSLKPLQTAVDGIKETVNSFQARLVSTEATAGENFERLNAAEATIKALTAVNQDLLDRLEDLENRSRRSNLRILNIPEGSEDGKNPIKFMEELLMEAMGPDVFTEPPELERAHRSLKTKPKPEDPARAFVVCFRKHPQKEAALDWARNNEVMFQEESLRIFPDLSPSLAKKRKVFGKVKKALYASKVKFRLLYPARLKVWLGGEEYFFDTAEDAQEFYNKRIGPRRRDNDAADTAGTQD